jgi:hypothetical protein
MARVLEVHMVQDKTQWLSLEESMEVRETKQDVRHKDNVLWGTGIMEMTAEMLAKTRVGEAVLPQDGNLEKPQLLHQPKNNPNHKQQLTQQPEPQYKPKPKPTLTPATQWETVKPHTESIMVPTGPGPGPTPITGWSMVE